MFDDGCGAIWQHANAIYFHDALKAWCDGSPGCMEAKKHALLTKLDEGVVNYRRADAKPFPASVYELASARNLLVDKNSFVEWASSVSNQVEKESLQQNLKVPLRALNTNLAIIGTMLKLLLGKSASGKPYSEFNSQAAIIDMLVINHGGIDGISKRNLEDKFSDANKYLDAM